MPTLKISTKVVMVFFSELLEMLERPLLFKNH